MRSRLRSLAALLALCALSLSVTGSAWAAMCGGVPDGPAPAGAAHAHAGHGAAHSHGHQGTAPAPAEHPDGPRPGEGDAPPCPLMAPGGAGSCLGTFVGAEVSGRAALHGVEVHHFPAPRDVRGLLAPSPPFRPPEA